MKIVMVLTKLRYGGAEKIFMWLASTLAKQGHEIIVFTYIASDLKTLPYPIHWIQQDLVRANYYTKYKAYKQIIRTYTPDCCISFQLETNILNILACLSTSTKSIVCERCDPYKPHYYKLKLVKPLFRLADGAVFQLEKARMFYSMVKKPTAVIPNPAFQEFYFASIKPFHERENIIVTLSRYDIFQKRQDILIKAFHKFQKQYSQFKLLIYGDGKDKHKIEKLIRKLGLQDCVILAGYTDKVKEVIKRAKFFVLSSDFEGIPNALIEAMSVGIPCISTDCSPGGASLLITDGVNGGLVPKGDINALYKKMCYFVKEWELTDKMGYEGQKIIKRFSEEKIIDLWNGYLKRVVRG